MRIGQRGRKASYLRASRAVLALAVAAYLTFFSRSEHDSFSMRRALAQTSLVAAYALNEGSGSLVTDASGNNNHGTISGAVWSSTARYGTSLSFDGVNDLVTIPDSASLDLTTAFTLEAWARPTSTVGWRTVLYKEGVAERAYGLYANDNALRPSAWFRTPSGSNISAVGTSRLTTNAWAHLAATYDGAALRLYVNGVLVRTRTATGGARVTGNPLRIGGNSVSGEYFRGQIDEIRIYSRTLSAADVQLDMNTAVASTPDTTAPTVSLTAPDDASVVTKTVTVTAAATDDRAVAGVQFLLDGASLGAEDLTAPYSVSWNTATALNGAHTLSARARDAAGNSAVSPAINVTADNPPVLVITQPAAGATITGTTVNVAYTTTGDLTGVDHVHFVLDGGSEVMDIGFDGLYQFLNVPPSSHTLNGFLVRADHTKIAGTDAVPVTFTTAMPDETPPLVAMSAPAAGAVLLGALMLRADASDNVGVVGVQFLLDGVALGVEDTAAPYEVAWNTTSTWNGSHALSARARDASLNVTVSASIDVTVANTTGPSAMGQWTTPFSLPVVAIHQILLPTGKVLMWDAGDFTPAPPYLFDPSTRTTTAVAANNTDMFCSGHVMLADGRLLVVGGDTKTTGQGVADVNRFDPSNSTWTAMAPMSYRRWYPTAVTLSDGRVLVMSGYGDCSNDASCLVQQLETYDPRSNAWTTLPSSATLLSPSYPFLFSLPGNRVLLGGVYESTMDTRVLNLATNTWTVIDPIRLDAASAVHYAPGKIMKAGKWATADPPFTAGHANTYVLNMNDAQPAYRMTAPMNFPRAYPVLTLLPDGTTLATGGSRSTDPADLSQAVLEAEIWSPETELWVSGARMQNGRLYHGSAMLLPDGRVLIAGSGRYGSPEQFNGEIYSPPYLFKGPRPAILSAPPLVKTATSFTVTTDATDVTAITLLRTGSMTHNFNPDQRFLKLAFSQAENGLLVDAPADTGVAPPGYYLLFLINSNGVPSVGSFVRIPSPTEDLEAPSAPGGVLATGGLATAALSWLASTDNVGVTGYNIHRSTTAGFTPNSSNRVGQTSALAYTDAGLAAGTYYYQLVAYDATGNTSAPSLEVWAIATADTEPPSVAITSPAGGSSVSGTIALTATASDDVAVGGVKFLIDGVMVGAEDTTAPYSVQWNTATVSNGTHQLTAVARDPSGNTATTAPISLTVGNTAPTGLVLGLSFNEGSGTTAFDSSGRNNTGTLTNAAWTAGKFGGGLQFNGTSSWVTVADSASLDLTTGITLSAWVNPSSLSTWRTIMLKERGSALAYALYATDGATRPPSSYMDMPGEFNVVGPSILPLNTWTHVAVTFDGAQMRLYVNSALAATRSASGSVLASTGPLRIGGNAIWTEYFAGIIDEVRVYNRALTQTEIQTQMNAPLQ